MNPISVILTWSFISFLYFKIAFDAAFNADLSIIASLILSLLFGITAFSSLFFYSARICYSDWLPRRLPLRFSEVSGRTIWHFLGITTLYALFARMIIFGFSKNMNREIDIFDYRGHIEGEFIRYLVIVTTPSFLLYAICIFLALRAFNKKTSFAI